MRLDLELVKRNIFESRNKAKDAIINGKVYCDGKCIDKPAYEVDDNTLIECKDQLKYVSKGGLKLEKALQAFDIDLKKRVLLDIGSSTGGFTDCALQHGASKVIAVDVGVNQMHKTLRDNPQVLLYEDTDFRYLDSEILDDADIVSIDVSFISVTKLLEKLSTLKNISQIVCLIKPQFECGKEIASRYKGVIKSKIIHYGVVTSVVGAFNKAGFYLNNFSYSPLKGGDGNIEYLALFSKTNFSFTNIKEVIEQAFSELE